MTRIEAPSIPNRFILRLPVTRKWGKSWRNEKAGMDRAESEKIMDETIDYAAVSEAVRQELCLLFSKNYWAKKEPANVDELLAAAASVTLKTGKKPQPETKNATQSPEGAKHIRKERREARLGKLS